MQSPNPKKTESGAKTLKEVVEIAKTSVKWLRDLVQGEDKYKQLVQYASKNKPAPDVNWNDFNEKLVQLERHIVSSGMTSPYSAFSSPVSKYSRAKNRTTLDPGDLDKLLKEPTRYQEKVQNIMRAYASSVFSKEGDTPENEEIRKAYDMWIIDSLVLGEATRGSVVQISFNDNNLFAIKYPHEVTTLPPYWKKRSDLEHEFLVGLVLNSLKRIIPNFMHVYSYFECAYPLKVVAKRDRTLAENKIFSLCPVGTKDGVPHMVIENVRDATSLRDWIRTNVWNRTMTEEVFIQVFLQIFNALRVANEAFSFTHYDLHSGNVMIQEAPPGKHFLVPFYEANGEMRYMRTRFIPRIIDYGFSYINLGGGKNDFGFGAFLDEDQADWKVRTRSGFPMHDVYRILNSCFVDWDFLVQQNTGPALVDLDKVYSIMLRFLGTTSKDLRSQGDDFFPKDTCFPKRDSRKKAPCESLSHLDFLKYLTSYPAFRKIMDKSLLGTQKTTDIYLDCINRKCIEAGDLYRGVLRLPDSFLLLDSGVSDLTAPDVLKAVPSAKAEAESMISDPDYVFSTVQRDIRALVQKGIIAKRIQENTHKEFRDGDDLWEDVDEIFIPYLTKIRAVKLIFEDFKIIEASTLRYLSKYGHPKGKAEKEYIEKSLENISDHIRAFEIYLDGKQDIIDKNNEKICSILGISSILEGVRTYERYRKILEGIDKYRKDYIDEVKKYIPSANTDADVWSSIYKVSASHTMLYNIYSYSQ